jgi:hypothetical protein
MSPLAKRTFGLAAVGLAALLLWWGLEDIAPTRESAHPARVRIEAREPAPDVTSTMAESLAESVGREPLHSPSQAAEPSPAATDAATIRGRLVAAEGVPVADARLVLYAQTQDDRPIQIPGPPTPEAPLQSTCDENDHFELHFPVHVALAYRLEVHVSHCVPMRFFWPTLAACQVIDLGDLTLLRGGAVVGRVLDTRGQPILRAWKITFEASGSPSAGLWSEWRTSAEEATGEFRLEDLPPGPGKLTAFLWEAGAFVEPLVVVNAGEETHVELRYEGSDLSRRITVAACGDPWILAGPSWTHVALLHEGRRIAAKENESLSFHFDDLDPGAYTVIVDDPMLERFEQDGVRPGESLRLKLRGSVALRLDVRDERSDQPLPRFRVTVELVDVPFSPASQVLREPVSDTPEDGLVRGLLPLPCKLVVEAPEHGRTVVALDDLMPGEIRSLCVRLSAGWQVDGCVLQDAMPAAGADATLFAGVLDPESLGRLVDYGMSEGRSIPTDERGCFAFENVAAGPWTVLARGARGELAYKSVEVGKDEPCSLELHLHEATSSLLGRLCKHGSVDPSGLAAKAVPLGAVLASGGGWVREATAQISSEGDFPFGPLVAGEWEIRIGIPLPRGVRLGSYCRKDDWRGAWVSAGRVLLAPGEQRDEEFDLGVRSPGELEICATVDGAPAALCVLELFPLEEDIRGAAAGELDGRGEQRFSALFAGTWRLHLRDLDNAWVWFDPNPLRIGSGELVRRSLKVELVPGRLEVLAVGEGVPLANTQLVWCQESDGRKTAALALTDGAGIAEIRVPVGTYRFYSRGDDDLRGVDVCWGATGPIPASIQLPRVAPR